MKTLLYTGHDESYMPLAVFTVPLMKQYAEHHGYDFRVWNKPLIDVPNGIYWTGVCGALEAFKQGYDRAVYLDVDQMVTNMEFVIPEWWMSGFHVSKDWGNDATGPLDFSACGFVAHPICSGFFHRILDMEPGWRNEPFPEQGPMREEAKNFKWITVHPRRTFNCVPDAVSPGNVPEPWQPGDWCAHLTMLPLEDRIKLFHETSAHRIG